MLSFIRIYEVNDVYGCNCAYIDILGNEYGFSWKKK